MASIGGLSSGTSNTLSTIRGYGGLASGMDRDSLIEGMTMGTKTKIENQLKKQQTIKWKMEATRGISSKLVEFSRKYMSYTSSTNLSSANFFAKNDITAMGANSANISVTGSSTGAESLSILGVKQLAKNAKLSTTQKVSNQTIDTAGLTADYTVSNLEGESLTFKRGNKLYGVRLGSGTTSDGFTYDYSTKEKAIASINKSLENVDIGGGKSLASVVRAFEAPDPSDPSKTIVNIKSLDTAGNTVEIAGGSKKALVSLGFMSGTDVFDDLDDDKKKITATGMKLDYAQNLETSGVSLADRIGGKNITFNYNGKTATIKLPTSATLAYELGDDPDNPNLEAAVAEIKKHLQNQLDKEFGAGRIEVGSEKITDPNDPSKKSEKLTFKTMNPTGGEDDTSVLTLSSSDMGVLGKTGAFGIPMGESNRVNTSASLFDSGLNLAMTRPSSPQTLGFTINGIPISGLTTDSSINEIMNKINSSDAGVKISYLKTADKFIIESTAGGAGGKIDLAGTGAELLFGKKDDTTKGYTVEDGQDAIIAVKYEGSDEVTELVRGNNTFSMDGLNITVKNEFGYKDKKDADGKQIYEIEYEKNADGSLKTYPDGNPIPVYEKDADGKLIMDKVGNLVPAYEKDADGNPIPVRELDKTQEAVTFDAKVDSEKITKAVADMIKEYNEMLELVNKEVSTKPNRDYYPLTSDQKEGLSEEDLKSWNEKAKEGILFNDSNLVSLADSMRFIFDSGSMDKRNMEAFGISTSTNYGENGKLVFDETKFKAALESDPEGVQELFTRKSKKEYDANGNERYTDKGGLMERLNQITEKFASTTGATKGILIENAGSVYAPTSVLDNSLQKQLDDLDDLIERLNKKLTTETDRYIRQFTQLETMISQMNNQSSWLQQVGGA